MKDFLNYQKSSLQNSDYSVLIYEYGIRRALKWCDELPFTECNKHKMPYTEFLRNSVESQDITENLAEKSCKQFRYFLYYQIKENPKRYSGIKKSFIDSIRYKKMSDGKPQPKVFTLDDMKKITEFQPKTLAQKRTKAAACFLFLSGMRIGAFLSIPIKNIDLENNVIKQYPETGVCTKFRKKSDTYLFDVPEIPELIEVVKEWDFFVRQNSPENCGWYARIGDDGKTLNPRNIDLPAKYKPIHDAESNFRYWLKDLCELVGIEYKNPHAFRHGITHYAMSKATTPQEYKAISMNLMHNNTTITDEVYSQLDSEAVKRTLHFIGNKNGQYERTKLSPSEILANMTKEEKAKILKEILGL